MDKHIQEYIKYLLDQRTNLELTIVELKKQLNDLTEASGKEGTDQGTGSPVPGEVHPISDSGQT